MNARRSQPGRGLLVLADGAQAAFAAGAVAELTRRGASWEVGAGGGLGAHVGVLALLGEAEEAERRWLRDAELGLTLLRSRLAALRVRAGPTPGAVLAADPWTLDGWLDSETLGEHLAPEMAAIPGRLTDALRRFAVAVEDLGAGTTAWVELSATDAHEAGTLLRASATFPAGWAPELSGGQVPGRRLWGGVGAAVACAPPWLERTGVWDVVCGFPVPVSPRPALGGSVLELIQRREEERAGAVVMGWHAGEAAGVLRVIAPTARAYLAWTGRENADLGVEYPLPWERNAELTAGMVRFGAFAAAGAASDSVERLT